MAASKTIQTRIKSTKNIGQITKAMEAVSAVKMRKSEAAALSNRPYAVTALELLKNVRAAIDASEHADHEGDAHSALITERPVKRSALVVITSDKGLAGAFNANVLRRATEIIKSAPVPTDVIAVGKKSIDSMRRAGRSVVAEFQGIGDVAALEETLPIARLLHERFSKGLCDEVVIVYTHFVSALKQNVIVRKVMPVTVEALQEIAEHILPAYGLHSHERQTVDSVMDTSKKPLDYVFEPDAETVLERLIPDLVNIEIHQSILEANASEHSSRMLAMRSASENASELLTTLRVAYNKVRQAQITKELTEITGGAEALNH